MLAVSLLAGCGSNATDSPGSEGADPALALTTAGAVRGIVASDHRLFSAIPYALPPVGELRWKPPIAPEKWTGERDATMPAPRCPQAPGPQAGTVSGEDCLYLNVWTPPMRARKQEDRAVMVWIHGGSFTSGSGDSYVPQTLATTGDMVVVTLNYRLGAPGFLAHPALAHDDQVGNFGLLDQQAALRWVRDNIAGFDGDPRKVTIAGESVGATSVCDHLVAPDSQGLFRAAIMQSGRCQAQADRPSAIQASQAYAETLGCSDPDTRDTCLRDLPVNALIAQPPAFYRVAGLPIIGPATGQRTLPNPLDALASTTGAKVPVLIGTNHDEFAVFLAGEMAATHRQMTAEQYLPRLAVDFGDQAESISAAYPLERYPQPALAYVAVITDFAFACPNARIAETMAAGAPVYAYEFNDPAPPAPTALSAPPFPLGAAHSLELPYLFDHIDGATNLSTDAQQALSRQMIDYWTRFVNTGDPNSPNQPPWPRLDQGQRLTLRPGTSTTTDTYEHNHQCELWNTLPAR
ncbi:carboxylesterase family protein [Nocardia sp. NBC_01499]|uniref:carboxylesterase/lipase family protein n=1 Tax=Nocardia sp. NBC_01499 TaxID=2903597 RepID=UPI0038630033